MAHSNNSDDGWLSVRRQIQIEASRTESRMQTEQTPPERHLPRDVLTITVPTIEQPAGE